MPASGTIERAIASERRCIVSSTYTWIIVDRWCNGESGRCLFIAVDMLTAKLPNVRWTLSWDAAV